MTGGGTCFARLAFGVALLAACGGLALAEAPISIEVFPPRVRLDSSRDRQRLIVQAVHADGRTEDVTAAATASFTDPKLAALIASLQPAPADGPPVRLRFARLFVCLFVYLFVCKCPCLCRRRSLVRASV